MVGPSEVVGQPALGPGRRSVPTTDRINYGDLVAKGKLRPLGHFDVRQFGAVGDGSHDDRDAIQRAIDAAQRVGGGVIYFPAGTYIVGSTFSILRSGVAGTPTRLALLGAPEGAILKAGDGNTSTSSIMNINERNNVLVYGLTFDGNIDNISGTPTRDVLVISAEEVVFDSCVFKNSKGHGLFFSTDIKKSGVRSCRFVNMGNLHDTTGQGSDRKTGVSFTGGTQKDNFVINSYFNAIGLDAVSIDDQDGMLIEGNEVDDTDAGGFYGQNSSNVVVKGNRVTAANIGVDMVGISNLVISGNICSNNTAAGILIGKGVAADISRQAIISNNVCMNNWQGGTSTHKGGIVIGDSRHTVVEGNICVDTQGTPTQQYGIQKAGAVTRLYIAADNIVQDNVVEEIEDPFKMVGMKAYEAEVSGSPAQTISVTGIPAIHRNLRVVIHGSSDTGADAVRDVVVRFNNDAGGNYHRQLSSDGTEGQALAATSIKVGEINGASAGHITAGELVVMNYADGSIARSLVGQTFSQQSGGVKRFDVGAMWTNASAAINRVDVITSNAGTKFAVGSKVTVYGF